MDFSFKCEGLTEQFSDPIYPVLTEIRVGDNIKSDVVIYTHDRILGKFDFGGLKDIINHLPKTYVNAIKNEIRNCIQ